MAQDKFSGEIDHGGFRNSFLGRLAQFWLERMLDMYEVTGSSPVSPTI
jgi:hypothetical protein